MTIKETHLSTDDIIKIEFYKEQISEYKYLEKRPGILGYLFRGKPGYYKDGYYSDSLGFRLDESRLEREFKKIGQLLYEKSKVKIYTRYETFTKYFNEQEYCLDYLRIIKEASGRNFIAINTNEY